MSITLPSNYNIATIVAIDPSSNCTGVAIFKLDNTTGDILSIEADTIEVSKLIYDPAVEELHSDKMSRLMKLQHKFVQILDEYNPHVVVVEGCFFNPTRPNAFKSLSEVISLLHISSIEHNKNIPFITISPKTIKQSLNSLVITDKGKDIIKECIKNIPEIYNLVSNFIDNLDNHGIDAIAVGYAFIKSHGEK